MNIAGNYAEIAAIEEQLAREKKFLEEKADSLREQILATDNISTGTGLDRACYLVAVEHLRTLFPLREKKLRGRIFALRQQIENETK